MCTPEFKWIAYGIDPFSYHSANDCIYHHKKLLHLPATDLEMYPGTTETKAAAASPAPELASSFVSKYVTIVVKDENRGARKTQTLRMSMLIWRKFKA